MRYKDKVLTQVRLDLHACIAATEKYLSNGTVLSKIAVQNIPSFEKLFRNLTVKRIVTILYLEHLLKTFELVETRGKMHRQKRFAKAQVTLQR